MTPAADPLAGLRPLHTPPPVSWWPLAPGWWLLAGFALLATGLMVLNLRRTRMRRAALRELAELAQSGRAGHELLLPLAALLKRYALACYPAAGVAALTGEKWLDFLDAHGGKGEFSAGCGRVLGDGLFRADAALDAEALIVLARRWIRANRGRR